ncbi:MAG TPA: choice-of-anchor tandem repeat GloVer-containing protein [Terriglobales bacterium]|nr:choice-of-anchor tandem repeat GloVer-containing protein [Terriglobales bacterium]
MNVKVTLAIWAVALSLVLPSAAWGSVKFKLLHTFGLGKDGAVPAGPILLDMKGNIYGTTGGGGTAGIGTVFRLRRRTDGRWGEQVVYSFVSWLSTGSPTSGLAMDSGHSLYGTSAGGPNGTSAAYRLVPGKKGWVFTLLYDNGAGPGVALDNQDNVFGDMGPGAYTYYGAIAELSAGGGGWSYNDLYDFCSASGNCTNGFVLPAPPIWDGKGNMFGVTSEGGIGWGGKGNPPCWTNTGCGVIFEMKPKGDGTWSYQVLHHFASSKTDGQTPRGGLVMDAAGNFYGTTVFGGPYGGAHGNGIVFQLSPKAGGGGWKMTVIYDFPGYCSIGCEPYGQLALDRSGSLYGTNGGGNATCSGGAYYCGMIYKLTPQKDGTWKYSSVYKFHGPDGFGPLGVTLDGKGHIFGATTWGGKYNFGVAFEITP